jgi:hypothetical protein
MGLRDDQRSANMRLMIAAIPALLVCGPAFAQGWQEYVNAQYAFAVSFPEAPKTESGRFQLLDGAVVPTTTYAVTDADGDYRVTIADFTNRPEGENSILDNAEAALKRSATVKVEMPARVQAVFGRQLSLAGQDGSHISAALFVYQHRLYQITGTAFPAAAQAGSSDAIRFQQSLRFTGNTAGFLGLNLLLGALHQL